MKLLGNQAEDVHRVMFHLILGACLDIQLEKVVSILSAPKKLVVRIYAPYVYNLNACLIPLLSNSSTDP